MADVKTNQSKVYNALKGMGFSGIGASEEEFAAKMGNPKNREKVYKALSGKGYKGIGKDQAAFDSLIYESPAAQQQTDVAPQSPKQQPQQTEQKPATKQQASQPSTGTYKPTWQEQWAMGITLNQAENDVANATRPIDQRQLNTETYQKKVLGQTAELGRKGRVVEDNGGYIDAEGTRHNVMVDANARQQELDSSFNLAHLQAQLNSLLQERDRLQGELNKASEQWVDSDGVVHSTRGNDSKKYDALVAEYQQNERNIRELSSNEQLRQHFEQQAQRNLEDIRQQETQLAERRGSAEEDKSFLSKFFDVISNITHPLSAIGLVPTEQQIKESIGAYGKELKDISHEENLLGHRRNLNQEVVNLLNELRTEQRGGFGSLGLVTAGRNVLNSTAKKATWDYGVSELDKNYTIAQAIMKMDNGQQLSPNEKALLNDWAFNSAASGQYSDQLSGWAKAGMVTGESLPFMLEMALNPLSGLGEATTKTLTKYAIKRYGTKWVRDHIKSYTVGKMLARGVIDIAGSYGMATTSGAARTAADVVRRMTGEVEIGQDEKTGDIIFNGVKVDSKENPLMAIFHGLNSTAVQNWSEMAGNYLGFLNSFFGRVVGKSVIGKEGRAMLSATGSIEGVSLNKAQKFIYELAAGKGIGAFSEGLAQFAKKTQWHGVFNEYLEEVMGNIVSATPLVGDMTFDTAENTGVFNLQQNIDTFCGVALMGGFMSALHTGGFIAHKINYDPDLVSRENEKLFGDEGWSDIKTMIDNSRLDPREFNNALTYLLRARAEGENGNALYNDNEKKAILKYAQAVMEKEGREMANYQPRMASSSVEEVTNDGKKQWVATSLDIYGNTITKQSFDTEEDAKAYEGELKMQQQQRDYNDYLSMSTKLSFTEANDAIDEFLSSQGITEDTDGYEEAVASLNDPNTELGSQFQGFKYNKIIEKARASQDAIALFEEENGWSPGTVAWLAEQDPMQMDAEGLQIQDQARAFLEGLAYPADEVHVEHEQQVGTETAQTVVENVVSTEESIDPNNNAGQQIREQFQAAEAALQQMYANDTTGDIEDHINSMKDFSPQEILSSLDTFRPKQRQVVIDYFNAKAKFDAFINAANNKINEEAANSRQRHTFKGTIDGAADLQNVRQITDGTNHYYLVSGEITTDPATGRITGSTTGLIIGMDLDGSFVQLNESDGYMVEPVTQTLDQFEEEERERLGQMVTQVIDPNGTMAPQQADQTFQGGEQNVPTEGMNNSQGGNENTVGAEVAAEWLIGSGQNAINSTDYLLKALSGVFPKATQAIEAIRQKYAQQIASDPALAEIKDFMNSPLRNQIVAEIKEAINQAYPNNAEVQDIFDIIMQHPTGLPNRIGQEVQRKLDSLGSQSTSFQPPLTEQQADQLLAQMEAQAVADPEISLTQDAWVQTFGLNNSMLTPVGNVKMGEHQYQKLVDKNRTAEFGMVVQTLQDPDVVLVKPSQAIEGQETERPYSLVFVKTFIRNGEKIKFYASVTVQRDNMEVSISSHFMNANRVKERLMTLERIYTKQALIPNSSEWHLAEQQNAVPDLLPTQENNASSGGKGTNNSNTNQGIDVKVDKDGVKRYEEGTPIDDAIADILTDGFDVNEVADASIAEAQQTVDKINQKPIKTRKDLLDRKNAQDVIDYYNNVKARWAEMNAPTESEENVNVEPEQPTITEKPVSSQSKLTVEEQKQQRIAEAKAKYGEFFDDDFTKANDVFELVSMWVGRKRNLAWDDVNGKRGLQKELGWTRKIGGDTKFIETLLARSGEGMGVDEFAHMVWESPENDVNGEKRWDDTEIKNALLELLKSAQSKSDVVDYALNTRIKTAEAALEAQQQMQQEMEETGEAQVENLTAEQIADMEANLPFAQPTDEDIPDSPITLLGKAIAELQQQEGMPEIKLVDTDRMSDSDWIDLTSQVYGGAFMDEEAVNEVRDYALTTGVIRDDDGTILVFSDSQTPEDVNSKIQTILDYANTLQEEGRNDGRDTIVERTETETPQEQEPETPATERAADSESQGSPESAVDEYLQPRDAEEEKIIADIDKRLQDEIFNQGFIVDVAKKRYDQKRQQESDRATDMFSDDETRREEGQLFGFDEIPTDRSVEGVNQRAKAKLEQLQSDAERNSRIRGALDNHRRQTSIEPDVEPSGTVADPMEAIEQAAQSFRQEQEEKKAYGKDNKLVTQDRYEELKKRMKEKLLGQANVGFDPEILSIGTEMAVYHVEAGARKFTDFAQRMIEELGDAIRPYLKAIYNGAREMPGMEELRKEMTSYEGVSAFDVQNIAKEEDNSVNVNKQEDNEPENVVPSQQEKPAKELEGDSAEFAERQKRIDNLTKRISVALEGVVFRDESRLTFANIKAMAKKEGVDDISDTDLQELVEAEIVNLAREIANLGNVSEERKFNYIVSLYQNQPSLNVRDNDRINKQQYSTPAPMAFLMGRFCRDGRDGRSIRGLEPSAGNGMLTIGLPKEKMHVNDIDEMRLSNLQKQGFGQVTSQDGLQPFGEKQYDVVVTNPPFGSVPSKTYDGLYEISGLEHQMAINALESMKDDGRAAIIIGGNTEYNPNGTIKGKDRAFLNYLYAHYNVVDVINMDGKALYSRQGTGYPTRMILINGRKEFNQKDFAPVQGKARAEQVKSYDELYKRVNDDILSDRNKSAGVHDTESGESRRVDDSGNAGTSTQTGVRTVRGEGGSGQSAVVDSSEPSVSGSTNGAEKGDGAEGDSELGGGSNVVHGTGSTSAQPSGSTPARADQRGTIPDGRDDAERPDGRVDVSVGGGSRRPRNAQQDNGVRRGLGTEKVPYRQQSNNPFNLQSQMPAEQAEVVKKALEDIGDVDGFLVKELGYDSVEELHHALAAEQIDSVAMAIHQMNQGNAFIIGDQTGVGKGRQAAALIRYGVKKGSFPVFITVKKALFSDMYRDLCDIGSPGLRPFIWSAGDTEKSANVTDKDGNVVYERPNDKEQKRVVDYINKYGKLPPEYDYVLTTYDSFKSGTMDYENGQKKARSFGKKQPSAVHYNGQAKRDALETLAGNSFVIMDESHNAGGEGSNVSNYLQYITTKAKGLTFLSATFAKRPGNMPIYSLKTAIAKAGVKVDELIDAVKRGGATFQEIMSKALTEAGQMIRRERNMEGVTIDWRGIEDEDIIQKQREQYDTVIGLFNDIIDFQRTYVDPVVNGMNDEAADEQGEVSHTPGTRDMGINNTPFASRTYNMVQQVLLSLKAEEAAKRAIEHLKQGRKPVITVANTNEGAADEASTGEDMEMPDLSINLKKGLQGTLRITKKDAFGNTVATMIPFERISEEGRKRYAEIMDAIENASSGLSLSPIDVIKNELKKAGYKVGELTGRKAEFVYNEDGTVKRVKRQDTDKKKVAADFNNGNLDALILNRSAGTGISLHASSKFKDQRQRIMIVAQAQGDVNDEVQIRGRIDRTGQVLRGMYEYVVSQIPSEQRLLMMLKAKLRSLDANTTSSQKSKFNEMQVQDIINKYGDDIVIQYLAEHPDLAMKMCDPLKWGEGAETLSPETLISQAQKTQGDGATASKVLGRMALLTVKEQEKMLQEVGDLYQAEIDRLNEMGENDLEITEMPLKAKTLKKDVWEEGVEPGGKNPFADNSYVEEVEMDVLRKPMKAEEVKKSQTRLLGGKTWEEYKQGVLDKVDKWAEQKKAETTKTITERAEKKANAEKEKYAKGAKKAQEKNGMTDAEIEKNSQYQYDTFYKQEMEKLQNALDSVDKQKQAFVDALDTFTTDGVYALPTDIYDLSQLTFEPSFGKVIDIKISDNFSTTASTISFATLDGRRKITIPISGMVKQNNGEKRDIKPVIVQQTAQTRNGMFGSNVANTLKVLEQNVDNWDKLTSTATRKKGYIITGNLLKALTSLRSQNKGGKLISYTTDTGEIRQGILMSDNFDPGALTSKNPISSAKADLDDWDKNRKITSADGDVEIKADGYGNWMSYTLKVPKSKKKGEKYFNDKTLLSLMDGQFEGSSAMKADFKAENLDAVLKRLDELGVTVESAKEEQNDMDSGYSEDIENTDEEQKIIEQAKSDGTYMRAPNGADSNLTPEQWVRVRTKAFKKWFGDWEKGATPIRIVFAAASHGFSNFAKARTWAKANIARVYNNEETGGKGEISISGKAIEKFLSEDAVKKSDSKDIHMSILTALPSVIREGYLAESHPDYKKVDGTRSKKNGVNPGVTIHRVYGAVSIDNKVYRVKITLKEDRTQTVKTRAYSYEATKIELLDGQSATPVGVPRNSNNSILLAKLLKGIDKSYEKGKKIIDSSQIIDENGEPKVVYHGSPYGGIEIFDHTKGRSSGLKEFGSFFTDNIMVAGAYRDQREISEELEEHLDVEIKILEERLDSARNIREYEAIGKELAKLRRSRRPRIYLVFLNIRNPKEFDAKEQDGWHGWHELKQDVGYDIKSGTEAIEAISGNNKAAIMDETYDGIIAHNIADIHSTDDVSEYLGDSILVFKPNQIKSATENNGEYDENNPNQGYSESETAETQKSTRHKENIRKHVENLLKKLGTRNRTTVITSINGVRNKERRQHIEDMHKRGKKVYGWFENDRIYLYLPDIDSIYKAEQTIWHETVAHVGLRELLGAENYGKLLNRLWMEHKDKEMGQWVTQRMQTNGWSLHKTIDEWLAREAEKVAAERQERKTLWQKLAGWLGDMFREIGYRTNPTITDVRYLFWLSENQLREGEPMSAIKQANFLYRLEKEVAEAQRQTQQRDMDSGYSEDLDSPLEYSAKQVYNERLNRVETVFSEAYQDAMVSLKTAQNAIAHDKDIPDSQNAYMAENLMHGKNKNEMDLYNKMFRDPLIDTINKIMNVTGMNWGDVDRYVYTKSGLERNREFFVRDWLESERAKPIRKYDDLNPEEQDIYDRKAATIETLFEDGDIETEEEKQKALNKALKEAHQEYIDEVERQYQRVKIERYHDLQIGDSIELGMDTFTFVDYLSEIDKFIRNNIDSDYVASEHDYSGFRAMYGDEEGKYNEDAIIEELMDTEDQIGAENVDILWERMQNATRYGLERYREAGMRSDEQIDQIEQMFHWYVPMRGFKENMGEDMYQYFTQKGTAKSYIGGLLKHAKGRGSEAQYPISTIFAMTYKAISDCNQNLVNQKLYRLCQANPNDLIILSDSWAVLNEVTGEWEETAPDIPEDADEEEVRQITLAWEEDMRQLASENKAKKIKGRERFDYKPMDKKKQSEHIVDVRINGNPRKMIVTSNPRMAQALNGQLRFERGKNVFSKWNAAIKNMMATFFTSYSPTFALRNMFRDWTHFRTMLGVREGHGYTARANKYYRQSLFKMVGLFKKYRNGTLDESNEMERDFKEFMDNGGVTGFVQMAKIDDIQKEMEKLYSQQKQGKTIRLNNKLWEHTLGAIEALNEGIENNARFATYRASRHYAGRTRARSAYDAKEITVNFNRKGAGSKTAGFKSQSKVVEDAAKAFGVTSQILGEGRIFFNATVQAIATTFKNFQNADGSLNKGYIAKWAGKYALPPFMFGLALPLINKALSAALGGDGDDDPYANLPEWTRRKNLCFYIGNSNFITIPIGQELAAFLTLGDIVAGNTYAPDLKPVDRSWDDEMLGVMNTFSPVDVDTKITKGGLMEDPVDETIGRTFSVLAPLVAVQQNLGWTGRPIYREDRFQNDQYTPEYQMVYSGTNPVLVNASKLLHELGGGDDVTRGKMEVNPAIVQYLWEQYTGGPGKVFSNTISIGKDAKDILSGEDSDFNIRKVEGLKAFVQQGDDRTQYYRTQAKYRKYSEDAKKLYNAVKGYEGGAAENPEYLLKLEQISKGEDFVRMQIVREADKELSKINRAANKAEGKERKELRKLYNEQVKEVVDLLDSVGNE